MNTVHKAGGVITRTHSQTGKTEIYVVHRPRHDDWSLPKGHIDEGETAQDAAVREIAEETGFTVRIVRALPDYTYTMPNGEQSRVAMFLCEVLNEGGNTDKEVDQGEWMEPVQAAQRISYPSLAEYIQNLAL